jgi:phosphatidylinositol glycan class S
MHTRLQSNIWQACSPVFSLQVVFDSPELPPAKVQALLAQTQHALDQLNDFSAHHMHLSLPNGIDVQDDTALTVQLLPVDGTANPSAFLRPHSTILDVSFAPDSILTTSSTTSSLATLVANELYNTFLYEHATIGHMLASSPGPHPASKPLAPEFLALLEDRKTRAMKYSPTYHLTFTLLTPSASPSDWEVDKAIEAIIKPLTRVLSPVRGFTIDTQVQPYATFSSSLHPVYNDLKRAWFIDQAELGSFINAAEWPLSPSIGEGNTINFLLYVPAPEQSPLSQDAVAHSWLLPQWGSVYILNLASEAPIPSVPAANLEDPFLVFSTHLLSLLGLPDEPQVSLLLRLSTLRRTLTLSLMQSSASTLGALARLTQSLHRTVTSLGQACAALQGGRFSEALDQARQADMNAERAFFDKSMVGQVYFPDEHKIAVYLPLLGPVSVPLILALGKEVKTFLAWVKSRKER